ncbi:DUF4129 domain-containing protein [Paenibacillus cymbidii]|uniref:DUF4129 domain-containing protein n=1 Tax=Paenibacillus cymbidii TaxID=1639034 RepID=UPI001081734E|nr:DUF4129 domain-containing protein [Paenibacillus cymbidii]
MKRDNGGARAAQQLLTAWRHGFVELLLYYPFLLLVGSLIAEDVDLRLWLPGLTVFYAVGFVYRRLFAIRRRLALIPLGAATALVAAWALFGLSLAAAVTAAAGGLALYRGAASAGRAWSEAFAPVHYTVGLAAYFLLTAYVGLAKPTPDLPLQSTVPWLGLLALAITLFAAGRTNLDREAQVTGMPAEGSQPAAASSHSVLTRRALRNNRLLIAVLLAVVLLVGFIGRIRDGFVWLAAWLRDFVAWLLSLIGPGEQEPPPPQASAPPQQPMPLPEAGEPSFLAKLMETIFMIIAYLLLAALALFALYMAGKALVRLGRKLTAWLNRRLKDAGETTDDGSGYVDESESLLDWKQLAAGYRQRWRDRFGGNRDKEPAWEELPDNRARIRYLYRQVLQRSIAAGYRFRPQLTPRETADELGRGSGGGRAPLPDELLQAYQRTRYGEAEVDDATVARVAGQVRERPKGERS